MSAPFSLRFAMWNALHTLWGGMVFLGLYLLIIIFGPGIEGKFFPVITNYKLTNVETAGDGSFSFEPTFDKVRDCTYYGVNWFSPDERGTLLRIQVRRANDTQAAPETGPVGPRVGNRQVLVPPLGATLVYGIMHHDCGFLWQTRTTIGPFSLEDGSALRVASLRR